MQEALTQVSRELVSPSLRILLHLVVSLSYCSKLLAELSNSLMR